MTSFLAKAIGKKILGETVKNNFGHEDPYFEQVPATRLDGTPNGKFKKRRKALPPGISDHDGKVLTKVKRRAYRLDMSLFNCCGIRFGWGSVIGIVPVIGDILDAFMAFMVVHTCQKVEGGLPQAVKARMLFNIVLDFGIGLVPFLGDVADAVFRANTRNAAILEQHLREKGKKNLRASGIPLPAVDPSLPEEFDRIQREPSPPDHRSQQPQRHGVMSATPASNGNGGRTRGAPGGGGPTPPPAAATRGRSDKRRSFFGISRPPPTDLEMGQLSDATPHGPSPASTGAGRAGGASKKTPPRK